MPRASLIGRQTARLALPSLIAVAVFGAAACGSGDPDDGAEPVPPSEAVPGVASVPVGVPGDGAAPGDATAPDPNDTVGAPAPPARAEGAASSTQSADPRDGTSTVPPDRVPRFQRPDSIRGLYVNAWSAGSRRRMAALLALADSTEVNTFVVDIKDATGFVSHASALPEVAATGADGERRIRDLSALLDSLEAHDIYPVARIVVVKDPLLVAARPELAVQDTAGGPWVDSKGFVWLDLWNPDVLDYHLTLAREVAELGFPEIQWDYIRFPDAPQSDLDRAVFATTGGERRDAVRRFLAAARDTLSAMGVRSTADVFGVTTSYRIDVGIGQVWESFIDVVDAALPMVYPSHYWVGSFDFEQPNAHPYEVVYEAMDDAVRRSAAVPGAGEVVPWLQDFTLGEPVYDAPEVRAQIQAVYDAGLSGWVLWNPGSRYTEAALMPVGGWREEPEIRVARDVVPVSRRDAALERARRDDAVADSAATPGDAPADSASAGGAR